MKGSKKIVAISLSLMLGVSACSFAGCGENGGPKDTMPSYEEDRTFLFGGWDDPPGTKAAYTTAKEMGLDFMFVGQRWAGMGASEYLKTLEIIDEVGMKAILQTGSGADNGQSEFDKDTDFSQYPAVMALNYWDEPNLSQMDALDDLADWHIEKYGDTDVNYYVNLFPYTERIGGSYEEYLDKYCTIMNKVGEATGQDTWLSVDIYPLLSSKYGSTVSTSWLTNLEEVALAAKEYGADYFHSFILATQHGSYRDVSETDFRYQIWVNLAFGANSISYFTYRRSSIESFGESLVDMNGNPVEPNYSGAQKVNAEIHAIDDVYLSFEWEGMYPVTGAETENLMDGVSPYFYNLKQPLTSLDKISSVQAEKDTLIGQFHDAEGRKGYVVTNFADPYFEEESANKVELTFTGANTVIVCRGGTQETYRVSGNKLTLDLEAGEGAFLIPLNIS